MSTPVDPVVTPLLIIICSIIITTVIMHKLSTTITVK